MKWMLLFLPLLAFAQDAETMSVEPEAPAWTNLESDVVRTLGWKRSYVLRTGNGELVDPSGVLSSYAKVKTLEAVASDTTTLADAAFAGMSEALDALYAQTNSLPTNGVSICFYMRPGPDRPNFWAYEAATHADGTNDEAWVYFSQNLTAPPKIMRRYYGEDQTTSVEGQWPNFSETVTTNGYACCRLLRFTRPEFARGVLLVPDPVIGIGHPELGLAFGSALVCVNGRDTLTGILTNSVTTAGGTNYIETLRFDNGAHVERTILEEPAP